MSILRSFKLFQIFLVILVSLVSLTTFPSNGYCDDWIKIGSNKNFISYYGKLTITTHQQFIEVWIKRVFTEKGKIYFLDNHDSIKKQQYQDIHYVIGQTVFDYKIRKYSTINIAGFSKTNRLLFAEEYQHKWEDIQPGSVYDLFLNKLLKENNIQR